MRRSDFDDQDFSEDGGEPRGDGLAEHRVVLTTVTSAEADDVGRVTLSPTDHRRVDSVVDAILAHARARADEAAVRRVVEQKFASYADARVRDFIPILVERAVVAQIRSEAMAELDASSRAG